jgi:hypothetical protein
MSQNAADRQRKGEFNKITGNFGFNYDSTNTYRDNGVNGVSGSGQMAVGCNQRHTNNTVFDNQGKLNLEARKAQSARAVEQAEALRSQSGFRNA